MQVAPKDILFRGLNVRMVIASGTAEAIKVQISADVGLPRGTACSVLAQLLRSNGISSLQ